nr:ribonuclease H-like domain-containing protein [Tanacetum cinerariifolium]
MDVEVKKDDLNQKFLTSLAPEWLMHTIVWRNRNDLDTMSLDDLYNHLKVYEAEVQKKSNSNPQDMAFISSSKNSSNEDGNTALDAGANSTNLSGIKDAANQEVKNDVSSLRYIVLPNWAHDALLESSLSKPHDESSSQVPKGSGNPNPTVSLSNPPADQMETLTVESPIPTVSSPVPTACLNDSSEPSNILGVTTSSDEAIGVEADVCNMETTISASPTPTLRIYKDHPKSQIISPVDTPIQTRHKSKIMEEQCFIATIHQKADPALLQFCLFSCFLS